MYNCCAGCVELSQASRSRINAKTDSNTRKKCWYPDDYVLHDNGGVSCPLRRQTVCDSQMDPALPSSLNDPPRLSFAVSSVEGLFLMSSVKHVQATTFRCSTPCTCKRKSVHPNLKFC